MIEILRESSYRILQAHYSLLFLTLCSISVLPDKLNTACSNWDLHKGPNTGVNEGFISVFCRKFHYVSYDQQYALTLNKQVFK